MSRFFRRRKFCRFSAENVIEIDYKDLDSVQNLIEIKNLTFGYDNSKILIQNTNISTEKMIEFSTRLGVLVNMIDEKELRWLELDEKNNIYE